MSGYQAFASWVDYLKTELATAGITVVTEKHETPNPPFLRVSDGPDEINGGWLSSRLCQAWIVVEKQSTEPLPVTMGNVVDRVIRATIDPGHLAKFNYPADPYAQVGTYIPKISNITGDMSNDPNRGKKVITWELHSSTR